MKWLKALVALFSALRIGSELRSAAAWKNVQVVASFLAALAGLAATLGYDLKLSDETITGGAVFIVAIINGLLVVLTSKKVGLPARGENECAVDLPVDADRGFADRDGAESGLDRAEQSHLVPANQPAPRLAVAAHSRPLVADPARRPHPAAGGMHQPVSSATEPSDLSSTRPDSSPPVVTGWVDRD